MRQRRPAAGAVVGLGHAVRRHLRGAAGPQRVPVHHAGVRAGRHGGQLDPDRAGPPVHPADGQLLATRVQPPGPGVPLRPGLGRGPVLGPAAGPFRPRGTASSSPCTRSTRGSPPAWWPSATARPARPAARWPPGRWPPRSARSTRRCSAPTGCRTSTCCRSWSSPSPWPRSRRAAGRTRGSRRCPAGSSSTATPPSCSWCRPWRPYRRPCSRCGRPAAARCGPGRPRLRAVPGAWRAWLPAAVISAVFALPLIAQLVLHGDGNFARYFAYGSSSAAGGHGAAQVAGFVLWFWWPARYAWLAPVLLGLAAAGLTGRLPAGPLRGPGAGRCWPATPWRRWRSPATR